jgi:hypothetical protein
MFVPQIRGKYLDNSIYKSKEDKEPMIVTAKNRLGMQVGKNELGDPVFKPYINFIVTDDSGKKVRSYLMELIGVTNKWKDKNGEERDGNPIYKRSQEMGYNSKGRIIKEYGLEESMLDENKANVPTKDEALDMMNKDNAYKGKYDYLDINANTPIKSNEAPSMISDEDGGNIPEEDTKFNGEAVNDVKSNFTGQMTFIYGKDKRSDIQSETTLDAIKSGEKTATTRYESDNNIDYWKQVKVGDIRKCVITWSNKKGDTVEVEVTKPLTKLNNNTSPEEWSKKEGWSIDYFNRKVKPRINEAYQMEFRLKNESDISNEEIDKANEDLKHCF